MMGKAYVIALKACPSKVINTRLNKKVGWNVIRPLAILGLMRTKSELWCPPRWVLWIERLNNEKGNLIW